MSDNAPLTKEERESLTDYERGFLASMWEYGIWKDGMPHVGAMSTPIHKAARDFLTDHRSRNNKSVKRLRFFGSSDDLFECYEGHASLEEIDAWNKVAVYHVHSPLEGVGLLVTAAYNAKGFHHACWTIGISSTGWGEEIPAWPVRYELNDGGYSPVLILDAPKDAVVREWEPKDE